MQLTSVATQPTQVDPGLLQRVEHSAAGPLPALFDDFEGVGIEMNYPRGTTMFMEDQEPKYVFIVSSGRVKLSISSREGRTIIVRVVGPGAVLGLSAALASRPHEVTGEVIENVRATAIPVAEFMAFMQRCPGAALAATKLILQEHDAVFSDIRRLALPGSIAGRLANLLLGWLKERRQAGQKEPRLTVTLTQEEIAAMTGTSRETVSRVLQQFRREKLISIKGVSLTILRPEALQQLAV